MEHSAGWQCTSAGRGAYASAVGREDEPPPFTRCALKPFDNLVRQAVSVSVAAEQGILFQPLRWCAALGSSLPCVPSFTSAHQLCAVRGQIRITITSDPAALYIYTYTHACTARMKVRDAAMSVSPSGGREREKKNSHDCSTLFIHWLCSVVIARLGLSV